MACFYASQRVQRRKAELTLAQIRENYQTAGPIGTKFGTHVQIYMGMDLRQTDCPSRHKEVLGVFRGSTIKKSLGKVSDWHQLWFTSADSSGNEHRLNTSRPSIPRLAFGGGGLGCHKFKSHGKLSNGWTDWPQLWHTSADPSGNGYTPNKLPLETQGALGGGGVRGQTFKSLEKLSNGWTDWHQLWFTFADSSGNGHMLNTSRPTVPQGHFGGF